MSGHGVDFLAATDKACRARFFSPARHFPLWIPRIAMTGPKRKRGPAADLSSATETPTPAPQGDIPSPAVPPTEDSTAAPKFPPTPKSPETLALDGLEAVIAQAHELLPAFLREAAQAKSSAQLEDLRIRYLGKKGRLSNLMRLMGGLSNEDRPAAGKIINEQKEQVLAELDRRSEMISRAEQLEQLRAERLDLTLPGTPPRRGHLHPVTQILRQMENIFLTMGFEIVETGEIETEWHNFEALNMPADHPARDMQDTFYVEGGRVLRTHTSPGQIHAMLGRKPPVAVIAPGKVYRCDDDVTHSPMFHQVEGFMVDRAITFGHLKGVLNEFIHALFGPSVPTRFRPSFFPFTEPSAEVDMGCIFCGQKGGGCRICSDTGWIEILGCGMIHPTVLENVGYDPEQWSGFAFGVGVERVAMLKFGIGNIRLFYESDQRFLEQF
jgi:phenylalanyl-tRNA synthetase alpha chain